MQIKPWSTVDCARRRTGTRRSSAYCLEPTGRSLLVAGRAYCLAGRACGILLPGKLRCGPAARRSRVGARGRSVCTGGSRTGGRDHLQISDSDLDREYINIQPCHTSLRAPNGRHTTHQLAPPAPRPSRGSLRHVLPRPTCLAHACVVPSKAVSSELPKWPRATHPCTPMQRPTPGPVHQPAATPPSHPSFQLLTSRGQTRRQHQPGEHTRGAPLRRQRSHGARRHISLADPSHWPVQSESIADLRMSESWRAICCCASSSHTASLPSWCASSSTASRSHTLTDACSHAMS